MASCDGARSGDEGTAKAEALARGYPTYHLGGRRIAPLLGYLECRSEQPGVDSTLVLQNRFHRIHHGLRDGVEGSGRRVIVRVGPRRILVGPWGGAWDKSQSGAQPYV